MKKMKTPTLETKRLVLRPVTLDDAPELQKHFNNWNIIKQLNDKIPWPYPKDGTYTFLKEDMLPRIKNGTAHGWCILLNDEIIGFIEYRHDPKSPEEDRGFWLAEPYWKRGYMSEAVTAVNDFVFNELGVKKMMMTNFIENDGSHRVKEKTGATYVKTITERWRGENREKEIWELTAENWERFKKQ